MSGRSAAGTSLNLRRGEFGHFPAQCLLKQGALDHVEFVSLCREVVAMPRRYQPSFTFLVDPVVIANGTRRFF
jgi:hypothetical protein